jgi:hypothetical protein
MKKQIILTMIVEVEETTEKMLENGIKRIANQYGKLLAGNKREYKEGVKSEKM